MRLGDRAAMSTASVLIAADPPTLSTDTPRYTLLLSTDSALIDAAQRLRHDVFTSEPGFELAGAIDGRDADRRARAVERRADREEDAVVERVARVVERDAPPFSVILPE